MAIRPLNSVAGISVGETPANIILANGDITTINFTANGVSNLGPIANVKITGGSSGQAITTDGAGNLVFTTIASGTLSNGTSNITVLNSANITFSSAGTANVMVITNTGVNVAGTFNTGSGNANVGNLGTAQVLATANVTAPQIIANIATGTAPFLVNSNTVVANLNADLLDGFNSATANTASTVAVRDTNGNLSANFFIGNGSQLTGIITSVSNMSNGTSNVDIPVASGNVNTSVGGTANVLVVTSTGANILGTLNTGTGNANVGNIGATRGVFTNVAGEGGNLSNIQGGNVSGAVASATNAAAVLNNVITTGTVFPTFISSTANGNYALTSNTAYTANIANGFLGATLIGGTLTTAAQPNITSVGTLTSLGVNGTVTAVAFTANTGVFTGNGSGLSAIAGGNVTGTVANATNATAVQTNTSTSSTVYLAGVTSSSNGNSALNIVTGITANFASNTITASTFTGILANGNSNVTITANGNVTINAVGGTRITATSTGANVTGTLGVSGNANVGNLGTAQVLASANITAPQLISNVADGTAPLVVTSTTRVANLNVAYANVADNINVTAPGTGTGYVVFANATTGNVAEFTSAGITSNLANNSITATTFVGALSGAATTAGTVTTNAQPNITSVGTLTSLIVGNATSNTTFGNGIFTATGNANVGNLGTAGLITATGNVSGGNLTTSGIVTATGNIVSNANVVTDLIVGRTSSVTITATGTNQNINLVPTGIGTVNVGNFIIANVATPVADFDAATKKYVDDVAQGLHTHDACQAATPDTLAIITGGTVTYNNGASGVGANLTTTGTFNLIDTVNVQTAGTRILVKNEANTAHNGIYVWSNATVITRADDFNTPAEMAGGDFTFVQAGALYDNTGWVMPDAVTTVGTSPVVWVQFSGAGTYTAGTGLQLDGSVFSIANTTVTPGAYGNGDYNATFTVNQQGQLSAAANVAITANAANLTGTTLAATIVNSSLTSVGTLGSLSVTGNVTAANFIGRLANGNSNVNIPAANGNVTISAIGNANIVVITGTGANITGTLNVSGNANVGNLGTAQVLASANITAPQLISNVAGGTAPLVVTSTTRVANLNVAYANVSDFGVVTTQSSGVYYPTFVSAGTTANYAFASNTAITANLANGALIATTFVGNISGNISGVLANGTSNVSIPAVNGNVNIVAAGNTTLVVTGTGANITGTANISGNLAAGNISATNGNLSVANVSGNVILGNSSITTTITWASATTTAITANQTIASFSVTGITGVEFLVKGVDATGSKYSVATVHAVTDGTSVDYSTFGGVTLGAYTGSLAVNIVGGQIRLQVTPASSNSTVWTTQYRLV